MENGRAKSPNARGPLERLPAELRKEMPPSVPRDMTCSTMRMFATREDGPEKIQIMTTSNRVLCSLRCPEWNMTTKDCRMPDVDEASEHFIVRGFFALAGAIKAARPHVPFPEYVSFHGAEEFEVAFRNFGTHVDVLHGNFHVLGCHQDASGALTNCSEYSRRRGAEGMRTRLRLAMAFLNVRVLQSEPFDDGSIWKVFVDFASTKERQLSPTASKAPGRELTPPRWSPRRASRERDLRSPSPPPRGRS